MTDANYTTLPTLGNPGSAAGHSDRARVLSFEQCLFPLNFFLGNKPSPCCSDDRRSTGECVDYGRRAPARVGGFVVRPALLGPLNSIPQMNVVVNREFINSRYGKSVRGNRAFLAVRADKEGSCRLGVIR